MYPPYIEIYEWDPLPEEYLKKIAEQREKRLKESKDDHNEQINAEGDLYEPFWDILDEESKLD